VLRPDALLRAPAPAFGGLATRSLTVVRRGSVAVFLISFVGYLIAGALLAFRSGVILGDAWSRVGNAAWMIISRDPHFAAVGFVWNPLPSLAELPLVAIRGLWPPLVTAGFAGNLVSAAFMAGAVVVVARIALDLGVRGAWAVVLVALFAINPMIVLYGANGMSEAPFVFFLLLAVRYLLVWWRTDRTYALTGVGFALALAYLTRYEAVAAAAGALLVIGARTYVRSTGGWRERIPWVSADLLVAGLPIAFAFVGWAIASWIITGNPFETFTSVYGNSSQIELAGSSIAAVTGHGVDAFRYVLGEILGLAPGLPILVALIAVMAVWRRRWEVLVPFVIFGSVLAFGVLTTVAGASFAWLRFSIAAIPLSIVLALVAVAPSPVRDPGPTAEEEVSAGGASAPRVGPRLIDRRFGAVSGAAAAAFGVGIVALVAISLPIGLVTMTDPQTGREEADQVRALAGGYDPTLASVQQAAVGSAVARYIDDLDVPDGSVIVDIALGFPIVLQSSHPHRFVITPDRDFERILADPASFKARYLLVPSGAGYSARDAVTRAYPRLFDDGDGFSHLVAQFGSGTFAWRLYEVG
jgi:hypothetical protein